MKRLLMMAVAVIGLSVCGSFPAHAIEAEDILVGIGNAVGTYLGIPGLGTIGGEIFGKKGPKPVIDNDTKKSVDMVSDRMKMANEAFDKQYQEIKGVYDTAKRFESMPYAVKRAIDCSDLVQKIIHCNYNYYRYFSSGVLSQDEVEAILSFHQAVVELSQDELKGITSLYKQQGAVSLADRYRLLDDLHSSLTAIYALSLRMNKQVECTIGRRLADSRAIDNYCSIYSASVSNPSIVK